MGSPGPGWRSRRWNNSSPRVRTTVESRPLIRPMWARYSAPVNLVRAASLSGTYPMRSGNSTVPSLGQLTPAPILRSVDFPEPFPPTIIVLDPGRSSRSIPLSTHDPALEYRFVIAEKEPPPSTIAHKSASAVPLGWGDSFRSPGGRPIRRIRGVTRTHVRARPRCSNFCQKWAEMIVVKDF